MSRSLRSMLIGAVILCGGAGGALAAGGGEGPSQSELVWQAVNLAILLGVIFLAARKPVSKFFAERREEIQGDLESASDLLKAAEARYAEWQRKLADLEQELADIRSSARQRGEDERDRILADARVAAERIREDARAAVDQEVRRAQEGLRKQAASLSIELAAEVLRQNVNEDDRGRLLDDFIQSVDGAGTSADAGGRS